MVREQELELETSHYEILGVSPDATKAEIESAYAARRPKPGCDPEHSLRIERARYVLSDPNLRRRYESELRRRELEQAPTRPVAVARASNPDRRKRQLRLFASLLVVLAVVLTVLVWPLLSRNLLHYSAGTRLERRDGQPYGTVLAYEPDHRFPNGTVTNAYQLRLDGSGQEVWRSQLEVNQLGRKVK